MAVKARKTSDAYKRNQARLRQAQKRTKDRARKAPTMVQITNAFGHAARQAIALERAVPGYKKRGLTDPMRFVVDLAMQHLRDAGYSLGPVTASRLSSATSPDAYITPS